METINLREKFARFQEPWRPKIIGELNDSYVKAVKLKGEFIWHHHEQEDELFLVVKGTLRMKFREREAIVREGEFIIVPRGVEHCPKAEREVAVMLFEAASTVNTGTAGGDKTIEAPEWI
jgi:mannose-6-phosphate isomerase-like protein (cupin superfamily)